jgi:RNA polymerase sigma-70 factor (ECF subfamily)
MEFSEKDIIAKLNAGDKSVFDLLFRRYYTSLCTYAKGYLKSSEASEEIVQEMFIRIWETHLNISIHTSVKSYLFRSVFNACINHLKKTQSESLRNIDLEDASVQSELMLMNTGEEVFSKYFNEEAGKELEQAIDDLPQQCREIFSLCRFEELSYPEISAKLNISLSTVKTQMSRAMEKLYLRMEKFI